MNDVYEMVIGLEVHAELKTKTKLFCSCPTTFGAPPNSACCPICMGLPGTLPTLNRSAVDAAILAGLITNCTISARSGQDRKNYFYPDMPKAYQITQYQTPLCRDGFLTIETQSGAKSIGITRIHVEEDAGKLIHRSQETLIDFNRCGIPLIEIVSAPDLRSAEEAKAYLKTLRALLLCADISDCRMNEGSLRCDVNLRCGKKENLHSAFGRKSKISIPFPLSEKRLTMNFTVRRNCSVKGNPYGRKPAVLTDEPGKPNICEAKKTRKITGIFRNRICCRFLSPKSKSHSFGNGFPCFPPKRKSAICKRSVWHRRMPSSWRGILPFPPISMLPFLTPKRLSHSPI